MRPLLVVEVSLPLVAAMNQPREVAVFLPVMAVLQSLDLLNLVMGAQKKQGLPQAVAAMEVQSPATLVHPQQREVLQLQLKLEAKWITAARRFPSHLRELKFDLEQAARPVDQAALGSNVNLISVPARTILQATLQPTARCSQVKAG